MADNNLLSLNSVSNTRLTRRDLRMATRLFHRTLLRFNNPSLGQ